MDDNNLKVLIEDYLQALDERNLIKCTDLYADDPTIKFQTGIFRGKEAIKEWHKERFAANFKVIHIDKIDVNGDSVFVEAMGTSDRLKAWKIKCLRGKAIFLFEKGKIKKAEFGLLFYNPFEGW